MESLGILERLANILSPPKKRKKVKYFHFHKGHSHDTEQCNELKKAIENTIKRGVLKEFIDSAASKTNLRFYGNSNI